MWICEQTSIISLYNINWLFYTTDISPSKTHCSLYVPPNYHSTFIRFSHWFSLLISGGSEINLRIFHYMKLNKWFLLQRFHHLNPSCHYMYLQKIIQHFYVLSFQCIYGFCVDLRKTAIISLYNINWLVYITELSPSKDQLSLYVPPDYHSTFLRSSHTLYLCVCINLRTNSDYFPIQH